MATRHLNLQIRTAGLLLPMASPDGVQEPVPRTLIWLHRVRHSGCRRRSWPWLEEGRTVKIIPRQGQRPRAPALAHTLVHASCGARTKGTRALFGRISGWRRLRGVGAKRRGGAGGVGGDDCRGRGRPCDLLENRLRSLLLASDRIDGRARVLVARKPTMVVRRRVAAPIGARPIADGGRRDARRKAAMRSGEQTRDCARPARGSAAGMLGRVSW